MAAVAEIATLRSRLDAWRAAGADRVDPVGFHRLEALARRCASADPSMLALLQPRIETLVQAHAATIARKTAASSSAIDRARPLAALVAECAARRDGGIDVDAGAGHAGQTPPATEHAQVPALQPARQLWKALRTERQLRQSLQKPHEDTGPLNSAQLVNRMLLRMGEASPEYLEHLIGYVDVLSELEHLLGPAAVTASATPSPGRKPAAKRTRAPRKRKD